MFFFKQKTAYEMRISDWSSDVCSSDLSDEGEVNRLYTSRGMVPLRDGYCADRHPAVEILVAEVDGDPDRLAGVVMGVDHLTAFRDPDNGSSQIGRASCRERVCQYV